MICSLAVLKRQLLVTWWSVGSLRQRAAMHRTCVTTYPFCAVERHPIDCCFHPEPSLIVKVRISEEDRCYLTASSDPLPSSHRLTPCSTELNLARRMKLFQPPMLPPLLQLLHQFSRFSSKRSSMTRGPASTRPVPPSFGVWATGTIAACAAYLSAPITAEVKSHFQRLRFL